MESPLMIRSLTRIEPADFDSREHRVGYTLLELVIVLAILTSLGAIAWPRVRPMLRSAPHRRAALQLKVEFAEAREQAVRRGQVWEFRFFPGTGRYALGPPQAQDSALLPAASSQLTSSRLADSAASPAGREVHNPARELPEGVIFPRGEPDYDSPERSGLAEPEPEDLNLALAPIVEEVIAAKFFPDGRATETLVELVSPGTRQSLVLRLRGLTGAVTIGAPQQLPPLADDSDEATSDLEDVEPSTAPPESF